MSEYPKEVLDALARDHDIHFKGRHQSGGGDARLCYGACCTWFGSIHETGGIGKGALPCCPHCGGVLFEMQHEGEWWKGVDEYQAQGHPHYRAMWEWQRGQKKCFKDVHALTAAFDARYCE
jgi:hypothetical protein